jgi:hypothetical protein
MKNKTKSNKMKVEQKELHADVILLKAPEGVDLDVVGDIIGEDNWDIIFLDDSVVCKADRVNDILEAYQECVDDLKEIEEEDDEE